jgi:glycosyltransferase involved in cell wall biosynthesis
MQEINQKQEGGLRTRGLSKHPSQKKTLISVITIVFNNVNHIEKTIQSVLSQSYEFIEYIIIDGGSTDGTIDIIRKYENQIDYWVSEPDKGIADAMNKGILLATGTLINHLNAGDSFASPDVVSFVAESYLTQRWRWCYGYEKIINDQQQVVTEFNPADFNKFFLAFTSFIPHQTVFIEKSLFDEVGYFDTNFKIAMDYQMWLRVQKICEPKPLNKVIAEFSQGGASSDMRNTLLEGFKARSSVMKRPYIITVIDYVLVWVLWLKNKLGINGTLSLMQNYYSYFLKLKSLKKNLLNYLCL